MSELTKKLQLKRDYKLLLLNAPEAFAQALSAEGCNYTRTAQAPAVGTYDAVLLFVQRQEELESLVPQAVALLKPEAMLWIAYPKKSSGIKTDLNRDNGWEAIAALGYSGVRQVAIDETWSALRFRHQAERKEASKLGVDMPGIDRKTKTVTVPEDMQQALKEAGVLEQFNQLAFTHRKEYVVAVLEAKRPETKAKRISKAIEQVARKPKEQV
ncbi:YdeI/OmpD-associated family protein [Pontibacter pamirensis]|uniref:YdeI/OmpD-associated family protein n=1 Tax=Pontibacter pamirensis TaxID=2562824 RepID=UPI00138A68B7|nr:YdeI/OmpD-associated family protein [Pontibacter pamirensis]